MTTQKISLLCCVAAISLAAGTPTSAAPLVGGTSLKSVVSSDVSNVRWRGGGFRRGGGAFIAGAAVGALAGAAAANAYAYGPGPGYYDGYAYGPGYYNGDAYGYDGPPVIYGPPGGDCWVSTDRDRGYGYRRC